MKSIQAQSADLAEVLSPVTYDQYVITEGDEKGLIDKVLVDRAIVCETVERLRPHIKKADDLKIVSDSGTIVDDIILSLRDKVYKGWEKRPSKGGNGKIALGSPSCGLRYTNTILREAEKVLVQTFKPYTPRLVHEPDAAAFALSCCKLFPNVNDPWECVEAVRQFFENLHNSCKTPGATFRQKCIWLVSPNTGFTGKSHFLRQLKDVLDDLEIDNCADGFDKAGWFDPDTALHTVLMVNDLDVLPSTELINGLIDRSTFHYNKKGGAAGNVTSCTNLIVTSNKEPWKQNRRRYNTVHFPGISVEHLTAEERVYFPYWGDDEGYQKEVKNLILTCPFEPYVNPNANPISEKSEQYADILEAIQTEAQRRIDLKLPTKMMPFQFVQGIPNLSLADEKEKRQQIKDFLAQAQNERKLIEKGTFLAWRRPIEFMQFLKWDCSPMGTADKDWLESVHRVWVEIINQYPNAQSVPLNEDQTDFIKELEL